LPLLQKDGDFDAFERIMHEAMDRHPTRLLAYCLMPNHWHMVLWPRVEGEITRFLRWLTHTHTHTIPNPLPGVQRLACLSLATGC
jgi:putative transposase